jgi:glycosyltransferase involved in cell wall biosynthesis
MHVGMGVNFLYDIDGGRRQVDGMGVYTENLLKHLSQLNGMEMVPVYFDVLDPLRPSRSNLFHMQMHPFVSAIMPFNLHHSLEKKIDVFHSTDFLIPKLKSTPVIATLHDAVMLKMPGLANPKMRALKNYFFKKHIQYVDHVIAISHAGMEEVVKYWCVDPNKISVVYCGISKDWYDRVPEYVVQNVWQHYNIDRPFLLSVGTIQKKKNYCRILQAYTQLSQDLQTSMKLMIVGKPGTSTEDVASIQRLEEQGKVQWLRHIPFEHLKVMYQSAIALIFPSLNEGFGIPVVEGFASQLPVLTSRFGATKEVASGAAYLVDPYDVDAIAAGMEKLITDENLRERLIEKGSVRVKDFSWKTSAEKIKQIYSLVC